jgi:hypothetical protein
MTRQTNDRHHETLKSLEPITRGHYMGETDLLASPTRAAESLAPGIWERLQTVRQRYDPKACSTVILARREPGT